MRNLLRCIIVSGCILLSVQQTFSQQTFQANDTSRCYLLRPYQIFDGTQVIQNVWVLVKGNQIKEMGPSGSFFFPANTVIIDMPNQTLLPGLIDAYTHLFLHPYTEASWENQILRESSSERVLRAAGNARKDLMAGFTTVVDMGTLGAGFEDVGLQKSIEKGVITGPRMVISTKAITASGTYANKDFANATEVPKGAAEADGADAILKEVRTQIGAGANIIYVYCESNDDKGMPSLATYTVDELKLIVQVATSANRMVVANASTPEGIKRAIDAGIIYLTNVDNCTPELLKLIKQKNITICPAIANNEAVTLLSGWKRSASTEPENIRKKKKLMETAIKMGIDICFGSDAGGVINHGKNYLEMELMADYGMSNINVLKSATSGNADLFDLSTKVGRIEVGLMADMIAVEGDPTKDVSRIEQLKFIMKDAIIYKNDLDNK